MDAARQRRGGQAPGTEPQESVPQNGWQTGEKPSPARQRDALSTLLLQESSTPPTPHLTTQSRGAVLTCQHAGEVHGGEVVVEVEDPAHQEEREVVEHPAKKQLTTSSQQHLGQPWAPGAEPQSAGREGQRLGLQASSAPSLCDMKRPRHLTGLSFPHLDQAEQLSGSQQKGGAAGSQGPCSLPTHPARPQHPGPGHRTPAGGSAASDVTKIPHTLQTASPRPPSPTSLQPLRSWQQRTGPRQRGAWRRDRRESGIRLFRQGAAKAKTAYTSVSGAVVRGLAAEVTRNSTRMGTHRLSHRLCHGASLYITRGQGQGTRRGQKRKDG